MSHQRTAMTRAREETRPRQEAVLLLDESLRVKTANRLFYDMFGVTPQTARDQLIYDLGSGQWNTPALRTAFQELLAKNRHVEGMEVAYDLPRTGLKTMRLSAYRLEPPGSAKDPLIVCTLRDPGLRQLTGNAIASLQQHDGLLKELHHRVKNNLQIVSSLLALQTHTIRDPHTLKAFQESEDRIRSMALVHEILYHSTDLSRIAMATYIRELTAHLVKSYMVDPNRIALTIQAEDVGLNVETAVPCGLMLNELVSNALKHAFPDGQPGHVAIELRRAPAESLQLVIHDNGRGMPSAIDPTTAASLGLRLVNQLVEQLSGTLEVERKQGTTVAITFPVPVEHGTTP